MNERRFNLEEALHDAEKLNNATEQSGLGAISSMQSADVLAAEDLVREAGLYLPTARDTEEIKRQDEKDVADIRQILSQPEIPTWPRTIYKVAGFIPNPDESFIELKPGTQNAAGVGAYFTESSLQFKYAGGERNQSKWDHLFYVVFKITLDQNSKDGWFCSKNSPKRFRFWHSNKSTILFKNNYYEEMIEGRLCRVYDQVVNPK